MRFPKKKKGAGSSLPTTTTAATATTAAAAASPEESSTFSHSHRHRQARSQPLPLISHSFQRVLRFIRLGLAVTLLATLQQYRMILLQSEQGSHLGPPIDFYPPPHHYDETTNTVPTKGTTTQQKDNTKKKQQVVLRHGPKYGLTELGRLQLEHFRNSTGLMVWLHFEPKDEPQTTTSNRMCQGWPKQQSRTPRCLYCPQGQVLDGLTDEAASLFTPGLQGYLNDFPWSYEETSHHVETLLFEYGLDVISWNLFSTNGNAKGLWETNWEYDKLASIFVLPNDQHTLANILQRLVPHADSLQEANLVAQDLILSRMTLILDATCLETSLEVLAHWIDPTLQQQSQQHNRIPRYSPDSSRSHDEPDSQPPSSLDPITRSFVEWVRRRALVDCRTVAV